MWVDGLGLFSTVTPETTLLNQGLLGAFCVILLGAIGIAYRFGMKAYRREQDRADRMEAKVEELTKAIDDNYVAALGDAVKAVSDALRTVRRGTR